MLRTLSFLGLQPVDKNTLLIYNLVYPKYLFCHNTEGSIGYVQHNATAGLANCRLFHCLRARALPSGRNARVDGRMGLSGAVLWVLCGPHALVAPAQPGIAPGTP